MDVELARLLDSEFAKLRGEIAALKLNLERRAYSQKDAAAALGVSTRHIARGIASGKIHTVDVFGARRIPKSEIDRLLAEPKMKSSGASEEQTRFDASAAIKRLRELRKKT